MDLAGPPNEEVRTMLRESLRGFLGKHWSVEKARSAAPDSILAIWTKLVGQGVASLGCDFNEGGLCEIQVVMAELGRAACPAPMWSAALTNLALSSSRDEGSTKFLEHVHAGAARAAFSFGVLDPDRQAGVIRIDGGRASGLLRFVETAASSSHLLVAIDPFRLALIELSTPGVKLEPARAMGAPGLFQLRLDAVPADLVSLQGISADDLLLTSKLALLGRAHGATRRAFELAVDYARERQQFGQPIGKFQAIQHKLANSLIALEGVRLTLDHAAHLYDRRDACWRYFANAAVAFGGKALRNVSLETQHTFGAIGYADEHEAPLHFKRVHLDTVALGGSSHARRWLAAFLLDDDGRRLPRYDLGEAGNALREDARQWLTEHWTGARKAAFDAKPFAKREFDPEFALDIGNTGWIGLGWPKEFGGQARSPLEQIAFIETMEQAEAPRIGQRSRPTRR
jgi:alkylation response protein AidB-like acyl-CoA dehydrogenase